MKNKHCYYLSEGQKIDEVYIKFPYFYTANSEFYRVYDKNSKILLMQIINSQITESDKSTPQQTLMEKVLRELKTNRTPKLRYSGLTHIESGNYRYFLFDYISGELLDNYLKRRGKLELYELINMFTELNSQLKAIRNMDKSLLFNNISEQNIFIDLRTPGIKPLLIDYGRITEKSGSKDMQALLGMLINIVANEKVISKYYNYNICEILKVVNSLKSRNSDKILLDIINRNAEKALEKDSLEPILNEIKEVMPDLITNQSGSKIEIKNISSSENRGFNKIMGMAELKNTLNTDVVRALKEKDLYNKYKLTIPNGILLYGPPGCGKTYIAEALAEEIGYNFIKVIPSDIASIYIHGTQQIISKLFAEAEKNSPSIIMLDEVDALLPKRELNLDQSHASEVNEFLAQMNSCADKNIIVIMTTNCPEKIDNAILRTGRIDKKIYIPPPDIESRRSMIRYYLSGRPVEDDISSDALAEETEGYSSSDIKFLIDESARLALTNNDVITQNTILEVIHTFESSIAMEDIQKYSDMRNKDVNERKIGFIGRENEKNRK